MLMANAACLSCGFRVHTYTPHDELRECSPQPLCPWPPPAALRAAALPTSGRERRLRAQLVGRVQLEDQRAASFARGTRVRALQSRDASPQGMASAAPHSGAAETQMAVPLTPVRLAGRTRARWVTSAAPTTRANWAAAARG